MTTQNNDVLAFIEEEHARMCAPGRRLKHCQVCDYCDHPRKYSDLDNALFLIKVASGIANIGAGLVFIIGIMGYVQEYALGQLLIASGLAWVSSGFIYAKASMVSAHEH